MQLSPDFEYLSFKCRLLLLQKASERSMIGTFGLGSTKFLLHFGSFILIVGLTIICNYMCHNHATKMKSNQLCFMSPNYVPQTKFGNILFLLCFLLLLLFFFFYFLLPTFLSASVLIKLLNIWSWNLFIMNRHIV